MVEIDDLQATLPGDTACRHCGEGIERGYAPGEGDTLDGERAVCDTCGWRDVGATGCAPTLGDFESGTYLVRLERDGDRLVPASITDEA